MSIDSVTLSGTLVKDCVWDGELGSLTFDGSNVTKLDVELAEQIYFTESQGASCLQDCRLRQCRGDVANNIVTESLMASGCVFSGMTFLFYQAEVALSFKKCTFYGFGPHRKQPLFGSCGAKPFMSH